MEHRMMSFIGTLMASLVMAAGCSTTSMDNSNIAAATNYKEIGDRVAQYRQRASELRSAAARLEWEAGRFAAQAGKVSEQAQQKMELAKQTWAAADEADAVAREYRKQLPHTMVY
ncbi:MAG: hypothetical protein KGN30_15060 [Nitrospirota bacterium]|nr:hypothetical protein [Nitrospirota bacterium]